MLSAMALSLFMQYYLAAKLDYYAINEGCSGSQTHACRGAAAVYRVSLSTALFFAVLACATYAQPSLHDAGWGGKIFWWVALTGATFAIPNFVFDDHGYVWLARVGAFLFVILQQALVIDFAYYANEQLVAMSHEADVSTVCGMASPLVVLASFAVLLFAAAGAGVGLLFAYFSGECAEPDVILSLTVVLIAVAVACQLFVSLDSNVLTSSITVAYATYLAAAALAANPKERCNVFYSTESDWLSILLGITFTVLALAYTIYSASTQAKYLVAGRDAANANESSSFNKPGGGALMTKILTGAIPDKATSDTTCDDPSYAQREGRRAADDETPDASGADVARFNIVMSLMAMNVAMVLTNWGSVAKSGAGPVSPQAGTVAMWMQAAAQWSCLLLYTWTCVAPSLFPDRDFS